MKRFLVLPLVLWSAVLASAGMDTSVLCAQSVTATMPKAKPDIPLTLLTPDILIHYISLKKDLLAFWSVPSNRALRDSAIASEHSLRINLPDGANVDPAGFDYVRLAAREPAIAALFKKNSLTPQQYEPVQIAAFQALLGDFAIQALGTQEAKDWPDTLRKNIALVTVHTQDLKAVRVASAAPDHNEWVDAQSDSAQAQLEKKDQDDKDRLYVEPDAITLSDATPTASFMVVNNTGAAREVWLGRACETKSDAADHNDPLVSYRNQSSCAVPWLDGYPQYVRLAPHERRTLSIRTVPYPTLSDGHYSARLIWAIHKQHDTGNKIIDEVTVHDEIKIVYNKGPQRPRRARTQWRATLPVARTVSLVGHTPDVLTLDDSMRTATFMLTNPGAVPTEVWIMMDCPWFTANLINAPNSHPFEAAWDGEIPNAVFWLSGYPQHLVLAPHEQRMLSLQANYMYFRNKKWNVKKGTRLYARVLYVQSPQLVVTPSGDTTYTTPYGTIDVVYRYGMSHLTLSQLHRTPDGRGCVTLQQPGQGLLAVLHAEVDDARGEPVSTRALVGSRQRGHKVTWGMDTTVAVWEVQHGEVLEPDYSDAEAIAPEPVCFALPHLASGRYRLMVSAAGLEDRAKKQPVTATLPLEIP